MTKQKNDLLKLITGRTCCRAFTDKPVDEDAIKLLIEAGQSAPSAKNRQPWFFISITDQKCKEEIARVAAVGREKQFGNWDANKAAEMIKGNSFLNSNDVVIAQAPLAILILRNSDPKYSEALTAELDIWGVPHMI